MPHVLGTCIRKFDPSHSDHKCSLVQWQNGKLLICMWLVRFQQEQPKFSPVVELVTILACHARGRGIVARQDCHASLAQLVEHRTFNPGVTGSNPVRRTTMGYVAEQHGLGFPTREAVRNIPAKFSVSSVGRAVVLVRLQTKGTLVRCQYRNSESKSSCISD